MNIQNVFSEFMLAIQADGLSETTIRWYDSILSQMVNTLGHREIDTISTTDMRQYIADLRNRDSRYIDSAQKPEQTGGLSSDTIKAHKRALFRFWNWCMDEYEDSLSRNPMKGIKREQPSRRSKRGISWNTYEAICKVATDQDDAYAKRDIAILYLLGDTGIRASGLCDLMPGDVDLERCRVVVTEKGIKSRAVPFTPATRTALIQWQLVRPKAANGYFCSLHGKSPGEPLTVSGLNQILKRLAKKADATETVSPHRIRHMFSREYLKRGGDLASLSRKLGHDSIDITDKFYSVFADTEDAAFHLKYSPLANFLNSNGADVTYDD